MTWLGAGGWVAFLSKMQSEDVLVRLWVGLGGRFRACGASGPDVRRFRSFLLQMIDVMPITELGKHADDVRR